MRKLLNTLYVSSQGTYLHIEGETIVIEKNKEKIWQLPIHNLQSIVCFGNVLCSPYLLGLCAKKEVSVSFLTEHGRFLASVKGPTKGNVLLRRQQYRIADDKNQCCAIASNILSGKLANCRIVLNRAIRDHNDQIDVERIRRVSNSINRIIEEIPKLNDLETLRGLEGEAASEYFSVFNDLILNQKEDFIFNERNRRPPLDAVNALLSFIYTILAHDIRSAIETVGLDPAVGFLHRDRPGRPGLALDIMEEFRPIIADRLVLSLINRRQVNAVGFKKASNGAVMMTDETRKTILTEYQNRKQEVVMHQFVEETVPIGLLFYIQANLMARFIRGDIDGYPPYFWR